jgi:hypothetical protein
VYVASATLPAVIYVIGITSWSLGYLWDDAPRSFFYWLMLAAVIPHFVMAIRGKKSAVRAVLLATFLAISFGLVASMTLIRIFPNLWMVSLSLALGAVYLIGAQKFNALNINTAWQRPFYRLGGLGILILSLVLTYRWPWSENHWSYWSGSATGGSVPGGYIIFVILICAAVVLAARMIRLQQHEDLIKGIFPIIALLGFSLKPMGMFFSNIYFFVMSIQQIVAGIRLNRLSTVNTGLLMLAVLIAIRFFDSDLNFVLKGLVMIALGIGFLVTNAVLIRRRGAQ